MIKVAVLVGGFHVKVNIFPLEAISKLGFSVEITCPA